MQVKILSNQDFEQARKLDNDDDLFDALDDGRFSPNIAEAEDLVIYDPRSECEYTQDFVETGSNKDFLWSDWHDAYLTTRDVYEWWRETIEAHQKMEDRIHRLRCECGSDVVDPVVQEAAKWANDLEDLPSVVMQALDELGLD